MLDISSYSDNGVAVTDMPMHEDFGWMLVFSIDEDLVNDDDGYGANQVVGEDLFYSAGPPVRR